MTICDSGLKSIICQTFSPTISGEATTGVKKTNIPKTIVTISRKSFRNIPIIDRIQDIPTTNTIKRNMGMGISNIVQDKSTDIRLSVIKSNKLTKEPKDPTIKLVIGSVSIG